MTPAVVFAGHHMNLLALGSGMLLGSLTLFSLLEMGDRAENFSGQSAWAPAPVEVPFKADEVSCEKSGRSWEDGVCLDYEHHPDF